MHANQAHFQNLYCTISQFVRITHACRGFIHALCEQGILPHTRSKGTRGHYCIPAQRIPFVKAEARKVRTGFCAICRKRFTRTSLLERSDVCRRRACRKQHERNQYVALCTRRRHSRPHLRWHRELKARVMRRPIRSNERWLTLTKAHALVRRTLSPTQVWWLHVRGIIHTKRGPIDPRRGEPVTLYPQSEVLLAAQMRRAYGPLP